MKKKNAAQNEPLSAEALAPHVNSEIHPLPVERLPAEYEDLLYKYIDSLFQTKWTDPEVRAQKEAQLEAYKQSRSASMQQSKQSKVMRVTYGADGLIPLLQIAELSLSSLFDEVFAPLIKERREANGFPVVLSSELDPDEIELRELCDSLDDDYLERIRCAAIDMAPTFWNTNEAKGWTPSDRVFVIFKRKLRWGARNTLLPSELKTPGFVSAQKDQHRGVRIPTEDFPAIASYFHVSFHWLMMGDDTISATAKNPKTELVLTAYRFMSKPVQRLFFAVVQYAVQQYREGAE